VHNDVQPEKHAGNCRDFWYKFLKRPPPNQGVRLPRGSKSIDTSIINFPLRRASSAIK
jgi:hypothetical protein